MAGQQQPRITVGGNGSVSSADDDEGSVRQEHPVLEAVAGSALHADGEDAGELARRGGDQLVPGQIM